MKIKFLTVLSIAIALFIGACGGKSDADLTKAVQDKLTADKITGVSVAVKDGVATLTGEVADITVKNKAAASAKLVNPVISDTELFFLWIPGQTLFNSLLHNSHVPGMTFHISFCTTSASP